MLDERKVDQNAAPATPERFAIDPVATSSLAETWTALFARLTGRGKAPAPAERPLGDDAGHAPQPDGLRAEAHAAFRSVEGAPGAALDAALEVMDRRIAELQTAVFAYGEALKSVRIYSADETSRATARDALRAVPERLTAAAPAPHLALGGRRHG